MGRLFTRRPTVETRAVAQIALSALLLLPLGSSASAFCGFYIKEDATPLTSRASRVVLLRDGTTTVLSMQSTYEGPPEDFALIVPIPTAIGEGNVRTLSPEVFDRVDELTSPRLVEYHEGEPYCPSPGGMGTVGYGSGGGVTGGIVQVEAQFAVGEYDVVVLGASESTGLERWLRDEGYHLPPGAGEALRPYVQQGFRFFAARVDVSRVRMVDGHALLSPLRIHYDSPRLTLPIRLGRLSADGEQDLIVYVLSREGRYEVANRRNVLVPTNLELDASVRGRFGAFYDAMLERLFERQPDAVVTEYAWQATTCDPCPGPTLDADDITTLGGDQAQGSVRQVSGGVGVGYASTLLRSGPRVPEIQARRLLGASYGWTECIESPTLIGFTLSIREGELVALDTDLPPGVESCVLSRIGLGRRGPVEPRLPSSARAPLSVVELGVQVNRRAQRVLRSARGFTLTRLRLRTRPGSRLSDLVFRRAAPLVGGVGEPNAHGRFPRTRVRGDLNTFQARYAILDRVDPRPLDCAHPVHGGWRSGRGGTLDTAAALAPSTGNGEPLVLREIVRSRVPALGLRPRVRSHRTRPRRGASLGVRWPLAVGPMAIGGVWWFRRRTSMVGPPSGSSL